MLPCPQEIFFHNDASLEANQYVKKDQYNGLINNPNVLVSADCFRDKEEQVWPPDVEDAFTEGKKYLSKYILFTKFIFSFLFSLYILLQLLRLFLN